MLAATILATTWTVAACGSESAIRTVPHVAPTTAPPSSAPSTTAPRPVVAPPRYVAATITDEGPTGYGFEADGHRVVVSAPPTAQGGNIRRALVADSALESVDQRSCVTWRGPANTVTQPGLALRLQLDAYRTRGIIVTNNIWSGARTVFNVHVFDTAAYQPLVKAGFVLLRHAIGPDATHLRPLPWRMCAAVVGTRVDVKVWPTDAELAEPSWDDPAFVGSTEVPPSAVHAGRPGIYIGHLLPGEHTVFTDADTTPLPEPTTRTERQSG